MMDVATSSPPRRLRLLLFWAPWHLRSHGMLADAARLAERHADEFELVTVDVDREPAVAMRHGLRSVPLLVLLDGVAEVARTTRFLDNEPGSDGLQGWLWTHGIGLSARPADFELVRPALEVGAFRGDPALRRQVIDTLLTEAAAGRIVTARVPFRRAGRGTIAGALAGSLRPELIENRTGLPFSLACALEFQSLAWDPATVEAVFDAIPSGTDLTQLAIRLVVRMLFAPAIDWPALLDDPALDALRREWTVCVERLLAGEPVAASTWENLVVGLGLLRSRERRPERAVQDLVIDLLGSLAPPPAHDDDLWLSALTMHGIHLLQVVMQRALGWTADDFAFEGRRAQWFIAGERREPGGRYSDAALAAARARWEDEHGAAQARHDALLSDFSNAFDAATAQRRARLIELLRELPPGG